MVGFDGHRGWNHYLVCEPEQHQLGIGRALMKAAEDWLKDRGCLRIRLMVRGDNPTAKGFYSALSYNDEDVLILGKTLG